MAIHSAHMSPTHPSDWLTTAEVATLLRVHPKHVYRLLQAGMPARRVGGQWRFSRDAIVQWAERRGENACSATSTEESGPSLVAVEPNELSEVVAAVINDIAPGTVAFVHTSSRRAVQLLSKGDVVAAIVRSDDALDASRATVRIRLGTRQIGLLARRDSLTRSEPTSLAIAVNRSEVESFAPWLASARERGVILHEVDTELDACCRVLRNEVDAALGSKSWAPRLDLQFQSVASESWELAIDLEAMGEPNVSRLCLSAQADAMRSGLSRAMIDGIETVGHMRIERASEGRPQRVSGESMLGEEALGRVRKNVRWAVLTRQRSGQVLQLVHTLRSRGLRIGGFVQVPSGPASHKPLGYDLYRLGQPERVALAERMVDGHPGPDGERFCELAFHASALCRAWEWLRQDVAGSDLLVIDGIGRLETRGKGLFPALAWARTQGHPKMIVLSSRHGDSGVAQRLALPEGRLTSLSMGQETNAPDDVVDHILHACARKRRPHARPGPE